MLENAAALDCAIVLALSVVLSFTLYYLVLVPRRRNAATYPKSNTSTIITPWVISKNHHHSFNAERWYFTNGTWKYNNNSSTTTQPSSLSFNPNVNPNASDAVYRNSKKSGNSTSTTTTTPLEKGISYFASLQQPDGHWPGDYAGPFFLLPGLIFTMYLTQTEIPPELSNGFIAYFLNHQRTDGGWGTHITSHTSTSFGTILIYVALRILGVSPCKLRQSRDWIQRHDASSNAPSWAKFWLYCLGLIPRTSIVPIPIELLCLPSLVFHPSNLWCHCRMVYLPMAYLYCLLDSQPALHNSLLKTIQSEIIVTKSNNCYLSLADKILIRYESSTLLSPLRKLLRKRAMSFAASYLKSEDETTCYLNIGPVNKSLNMLCCYYNEDFESLKFHQESLMSYIWVAEDGIKMQGYNGSQLWDTAFAVQALTEAGESGSTAKAAAIDFIKRNQITENTKDFKKYYRHKSVGGWPFSTKNHGWPISDCTAEAVKALLKHDETCDKGIEFILSLQNSDGGWGTYELNRGYTWYERLNPIPDTFGDIMIDYSYVECTSACVTALAAAFNSTLYQKQILAGKKFIKSKQRIDGSWYGSWGVCFTYGTWFGIEGLVCNATTSIDDEDIQCIEKAAEFLMSKQRGDGGWIESISSCVDKEYSPYDHNLLSSVVQTSWAVLALLKSSEVLKQEKIRKSVIKGIEFIKSSQLDDGDWPMPRTVSGVFNHNVGITYSNYRNIFPIWALARYNNSLIKLLH